MKSSGFACRLFIRFFNVFLPLRLPSIGVDLLVFLANFFVLNTYYAHKRLVNQQGSCVCMCFCVVIVNLLIRDIIIDRFLPLFKNIIKKNSSLLKVSRR